MRIFAIALNTARESIRNRILYSVFFFAVFVVAIAAVFGAASIGDQLKFVKDFALMSISLLGVVVAIVLGVNLLNNEIGKKTIYNVLSKPVRRWEFILGKFAGLWFTAALTVTLMSALLVGALALFEGSAHWGLFIAMASVLLELFVVTAVAIFFSSAVVTPTLAGLFTASVFIAGRSSVHLQRFFGGSLGPEEEYSALTQLTAKVLYWVLPHLDRFNLADQVVYRDAIDPAYLAALFAYGLAYATLLLLLSVVLFNRKEFA